MNHRSYIDWKWYPFSFQVFMIGFDETTEFAGKETTYMVYELCPISFTFSLDNQYNTGLQIKIWKFAGFINMRWWS